MFGLYIYNENTNDLLGTLVLHLVFQLVSSDYLRVRCFVFTYFKNEINFNLTIMIGRELFIIFLILVVNGKSDIEETETCSEWISRSVKLSPCNTVQKYTDYTVYPASTVQLLASYRPLLYMETPGSVFFIQLSSNGFFYPGLGVSVTCIGCDNSVELIRFVSEPSSAIYHKTGCEFIKVDNNDVSSSAVNVPTNIGGHSAVNVPTNIGDQSPGTVYQASSDTNIVVNSNSENTGIQSSSSPTHHHEVESYHTSSLSSSQSSSSQLTSSQIPPSLLSNQTNFTLDNAAYPVYGTLNKRMESLVDWPHGHTQSSTALAEAGFFYAGYSDCVRCFYCGLGLRSWKPGDDIYVEHERFRPTCSYLQDLLRNTQHTCGNTQNVQPITDEINNVIESVHNQQEPVHRNISDSSATRIQDQQQIEVATQGTGTVEILTSSSTAANTQNNQSSTFTESESLRDLKKCLLQRENQALKQLMTCKSCNEAHIQDLFLPCGEMYTCKDCSNKFTHCPSCGKRILGTVTVYFT